MPSGKAKKKKMINYFPLLMTVTVNRPDFFKLPPKLMQLMY